MVQETIVLEQKLLVQKSNSCQYVEIRFLSQIQKEKKKKIFVKPIHSRTRNEQGERERKRSITMATSRAMRESYEMGTDKGELAKVRGTLNVRAKMMRRRRGTASQ
ncbi:hypothetical protein CEXT_525871 [Caerostris extrusa]|uniref:Uncharacterized protein n=1 Tax=Caerostris extrusa TaxID=172846 RepID=A0AAV4PGZ6_CAEEX|nr:hypothetical protein CEXT_525871 [Caerostris extrusa]